MEQEGQAAGRENVKMILLFFALGYDFNKGRRRGRLFAFARRKISKKCVANFQRNFLPVPQRASTME